MKYMKWLRRWVRRKSYEQKYKGSYILKRQLYPQQKRHFTFTCLTFHILGFLNPTMQKL
jgi:hypothetical protein